LKVETGAYATRVLFAGTRATGVEYVRGGIKRSASAEREVIVAGGVINSPQLLMLSGVGDPDALRKHGIAVRVPCKRVGENLQDHVMAPVVFLRKEPGPLHRQMRLDRIGLELAKCYFLGKGIATDVPGPLVAFLKSDPSAPIPDVQLLFQGAPLTAAPYLTRPYVDAFTCLAVLLRPQSRGRVELASGDPGKAPRIRQNFLARDADWDTLRKGLRLAQDVARRAPLAGFIKAELKPANADLDAHIRESSITVHHPLGTCAMGEVVDEEMRVAGAEGLRVVDASVMPDLVGGNIHAAVLMIAEKAADAIRAARR
jgi:choline dehydrogenase/4-pyridoxate dehydrogenase